MYDLLHVIVVMYDLLQGILVIILYCMQAFI